MLESLDGVLGVDLRRSVARRTDVGTRLRRIAPPDDELSPFHHYRPQQAVKPAVMDANIWKPNSSRPYRPRRSRYICCHHYCRRQHRVIARRRLDDRNLLRSRIPSSDRRGRYGFCNNDGSRYTALIWSSSSPKGCQKGQSLLASA
jgi:hypothetical protein